MRISSSATRSGTVAVVLILLISMVAPVVAVGTPTRQLSAPSNADEFQDTNYQFESTPLELKRSAQTNLRAVTPPPNAQYASISHINDSLEFYRTDTRVESTRVFNADAAAIRPLIAFAKTDEATVVDSATAKIVAADNRTARVAVTDAKTALNRYGDEIDADTREELEEDLSRAEHRLSDAEAELSGEAHGVNAHENGDGDTAEEAFRETLDQRAEAVKDYGEAWEAAQRVLSRLDAETSPVVTIDSRDDVPRNGTTETTIRVQGMVDDVRAYELENVSIQVNDNPAQTVPLNTNSTPGEPATFDTNITFTERTTTVTVTAIDNYPSETPMGKGKKRHKKNRNPKPAQTGTNTLRLDGDGLPDQFERTVLNSDPLDPNSDFKTTDSDESQNDAVDGAEDTDGEGFYEYYEAKFGTNPFKVDTDGDGLTDRFEVVHSRTRPTVVDSDADNRTDGREDIDQDGLQNIAEQSNETEPLRPDTDDDGLADGAEVADYGTVPTDADTDDDGVNDGTEIDLGTDPLRVDTDGDGIPDADQQYTLTRVANGTNISVSVTGSTAIAQNVTVSATPEYGQREEVDFLESTVIHVKSRSEIDSGSIRVPVPETADTQNLTILKYSPGNGTTWHPINTTVKNGVATATVDSFSYFALVDLNVWRDAVTFGPTDGTDHADGGTSLQGVDVMLTLDTSGSMYGEKIRNAKSASKQFVGALENDDKGGLVGFASYGRRYQELTTDYDTLNQSIDRLDAGGGTNIGAGLSDSLAELNRNSDPDHRRVIVLLSDGYTSNEGYALDQAITASNQNTTIYTVAVGEYADEGLLREIALRTGGTFFKANDAGELTQTFRDVEENISRVTDSDEDGLPDSVEEVEYTMLGGPDLTQTVKTDPNDPDTDGDGLLDGEEVNVIDGRTLLSIPVTERFAVIPTSNPTLKNSDRAGINDARERERGSNPLVRENFLVTLSLPNQLDSGTAGDFSKSTSGNRLLLTADKYYYFDGKEDNGIPDIIPLVGTATEGTRPTWLEEQTLEDKRTYYYIPTVVTVSSAGSIDSPTISPTFRLAGAESNVELIDTTGPTTMREGPNEVGLIIKTDDAKDKEKSGVDFSGNDLIDRGRIGQVEMSYSVDQDSIYYRPNQDASQYTESGERVTVDSPTYDYRDFGTTQVDRLVDQSINEFKNGIVDSISLYSSAITGGSEVSFRIGGKVTLTVIKQTQSNLADQIEAGEFDGSVELRQTDGDVFVFTKADLGTIGSFDVYVQLEGPGTYREN